ncbi:MAG: TRAP transporter substrate-binding protein DctP [Bryobacteraceae bacterium]
MKFLIFPALLVLSWPIWAQQVIINVGTAAPEGSPWHQILQRTREDWAKHSGGKYNMRIYPSGTLGDENAMILKVRIGQLQAVALSAAGLVQIEPAVACLQIPMLIDSYEEFDYIRDRMAPRLEAMLEKKGFIVLQWSDVGWVHFFAKTPVRTPNDIRRLKLYTSVGDPEGEKLYKEFGFQVVPLAVTDLLPSLQTNLIQAFDVPPLFALLDQSFGAARNMVDLKWAPLAGVTLLSRKTWERIPAEQRPGFLKSARDAAGRARAEIRKMGEDAVSEMQKRGLNVVRLTPAEQAQWRKEAENAYPKLRGRTVPEDLFDEVVRLHNEFRAKRGAGGA